MWHMTDSTAFDRPSPSTLTHPGQLLANVPAILGFYPQNSIILAGFQAVGKATYCLGPVLRLDIPGPDPLPSLTSYGSSFHACDLVFCFVVAPSSGLDSSLTGSVMKRCWPLIRCALDDSDAVLAGIWGCEEIVTGGKYVELEESSSGQGKSEWAQGTIASVVGSVAMEPWVAAGKLPEISRAEAFHRFTYGNPNLRPEQWASLEDIGQCPPASSEIRQGWIVQLGDLLRTSGGATWEDYLSDFETLSRCASVLGEVQLRDALVSDILDVPAAGSQLMLAAAKSLRGSRRANALCLYSLAVIAEGFPMEANPALLTALEESPEHSLTRLILDLMNGGDCGPLLSSVARGSDIARQQLLQG